MAFEIWAGQIYCGILLVVKTFRRHHFFNIHGVDTPPENIKKFKQLHLKRRV